MRNRAAFPICFLLAFASGAAAAEIGCDNEASVAEVRARLKSCESMGLCKVWLGTVNTAVENFKAGKITVDHCTQMLQGISRNEQRLQEDRQKPLSPAPSPPGGGGGGHRGMPELIMAPLPPASPRPSPGGGGGGAFPSLI